MVQQHWVPEVPLKLKVVAYKGLPSAEGLEFVVDRSGGTIGRAPDKLVSRRHASIRFQGGRFFFSDTSAAGTYIASRDVLLQQDTIALEPGDRLKLGDYELLVEIVPDFAEPASDATESPTWPLAPTGSERAAVLPEAFGHPVAPPPAVPSFIGQPDAPPECSSWVPPEVEPAPHPAEVPDFDLDDLFRAAQSSVADAGRLCKESP